MYENNINDILLAQSGNKEALDRIIKQNTGLIWSIVRRFLGRGYESEDLFQIGSIGFIKAIKRFDISFNVQMSTYAVPYIMGEIKRFLRDDGLIKVSRSIKSLYIKIKETEKVYMQNEGKQITVNKLAEILKCTKEEIAEALEASKEIDSIDIDEKSEEKGPKISRISTGVNEEESLINTLSVKQVINELENKEKEIILLRFYKEKTQTEVARILGISQVQVSRIEKKVLEKMKIKLSA